MIRSHKVHEQAIPKVPDLTAGEKENKKKAKSKSICIHYTYHFGTVCASWIIILD